MITDMGPLQVRIPVQVRDGELTFFGGALPPFRENAFAEIVIDAVDVNDGWLVGMLASQTQVLMLPAGAELRLILRNPHTASLPARLLQQRVEEHMATSPPFLSGLYVVLYIIEDLELVLRGPKPGQLLSCKVLIPDLELEVQSLNQAYTQISRAFEPHRQSFGGNVFSNFFYEDRSGGDPVWRSLAALRDRLARPDMAALKDALFPWYFRIYPPPSESIQWAYPAVAGNGIVTLYLLDEQGCVWSEVYFAQPELAHDYLEDNQYQRFSPPARQQEDETSVAAHSPEESDESERLPPPPPYRKPSGEIVVISYSRFDPLGPMFPRNRQIRWEIR